MGQIFKNISVAKKLLLLTFSALVGVAIITSLFLISEKQLILEERKTSVRQAVETAYGIIDYYHAQVGKGVLSEGEAKKQAIAAVKSLRYSEKEYFWINDMTPRMVMHPTNSKLDGVDISGNTDPTGKHLFVEMVNKVKAESSGFVEYMWPLPGGDKPVPKISYVKGFVAWGWIVGSGVYTDTVNSTLLSRALNFSIYGLVLAIVLVTIGLYISHGILRSLGGEPDYAVNVTRHIAKGNLTVQIELKPGDNHSLLYAIHEMRNSLAAIVRQVRLGAEAIATASAQIATGNMDLSARTEQQASSLEETASSMEDLSSKVQGNVDNAFQAQKLATAASHVAETGGKSVSQVVDTMRLISDSSSKMSEIIGVIDGIAFQTNILALNAAVEAARAGEQGRGFAVVATEVRSLAQRSALAARQIKDLIDDSTQKVVSGSHLVEGTGETMSEVLLSIRRVNEIMNEITGASKEQSEGILQVNQAVSQMDAITQQNAALVEQAAAAAESLREQAGNLLEIVSTFTMSHDTATIK